MGAGGQRLSHILASQLTLLHPVGRLCQPPYSGSREIWRDPINKTLTSMWWMNAKVQKHLHFAPGYLAILIVRFGKTNVRFNGCFSNAMEAPSPNLICRTRICINQRVGVPKQAVWTGLPYFGGQLTLFQSYGRLYQPHYSWFSDLPSALNLEGSVPQIKLGEAASIAFEKHPLKRASVFP